MRWLQWLQKLVIAAAAREPEATEQGSTLIGTEIYLWGLASAFLQNAKDFGRAKIKGTRHCG